MTLYRDIAIAIAFGRTDPPMQHREYSVEERVEAHAAYCRHAAEQEEAAAHSFIRKGSTPDDYESVHEVALRPGDVLAAQHAMALHRSSPVERSAAESADYVTVRADGNGGAMVSFLKRKPKPAQATDDNAA